MIRAHCRITRTVSSGFALELLRARLVHFCLHFSSPLISYCEAAGLRSLTLDCVCLPSVTGAASSPHVSCVLLSGFCPVPHAEPSPLHRALRGLVLQRTWHRRELLGCVPRRRGVAVPVHVLGAGRPKPHHGALSHLL